MCLDCSSVHPLGFGLDGLRKITFHPIWVLPTERREAYFLVFKIRAVAADATLKSVLFRNA